MMRLFHVSCFLFNVGVVPFAIPQPPPNKRDS